MKTTLKQNELKTTIVLRSTIEEKRKIERIALKNNISKSDVIRNFIRNYEEKENQLELI